MALLLGAGTKGNLLRVDGMAVEPLHRLWEPAANHWVNRSLWRQILAAYHFECFLRTSSNYKQSKVDYCPTSQITQNYVVGELVSRQHLMSCQPQQHPVRMTKPHTGRLRMCTRHLPV